MNQPIMAVAETEKVIHLQTTELGQLDGLRERAMELHAQVGNAWKTQMMSAFLCGCVLQRVKLMLPHGSFMDWHKNNLPHLSNGALHRYMDFAAVASKRLEGKFPTVGNLDVSRLLGQGELAEEDSKSLFLALQHIAGGKSLTEFYRDLGILPKPALPGFRPDARALQGWLKKHCPELAGHGYEELPADVQRAFRKQYKPRVDPQIEVENYKETWREVVAILQDLLDTKKARGALDVDGDAATIKLGAEVCGDAAKFLRELNTKGAK